jgi:hypothetical protein
MMPLGVVLSCSLYSSMILSGMLLNFIRMNLGRCSGVIKKKMEMSIVINRAPLVEITLLKSILATSISAVGVATLPG